MRTRRQEGTEWSQKIIPLEPINLNPTTPEATARTLDTIVQIMQLVGQDETILHCDGGEWWRMAQMAAEGVEFRAGVEVGTDIPAAELPGRKLPHTVR